MWALAAALGLALAALHDQSAQAQCSMCQQVVSQSPEARRMGAELNRAILVMVAAPYLVFSSFAVAAFRPRIARWLRDRRAGRA